MVSRKIRAAMAAAFVFAGTSAFAQREVVERSPALAPTKDALGKYRAATLDGRLITTADGYEAAVSANSKPQMATKWRGTTGKSTVDYSLVLEDYLSRSGQIIGPVAKPGVLAGAAHRIRLSDPRTQMPSSPSATEGILTAKIATSDKACAAGGAGACGDGVRLKGVLADVETTALRYPNCSKAATAYVKYYPDGEAPDAVAAAYDTACLASSEPRSSAGSFIHDSLPPVLAALSNPATGGLSPIAVLEVDGTPFCGALLRNNHTLITARHCFEGAAAGAWKAGAIRLRPVDGRGGPWQIDKNFLKAGADASTARTDWAVVKILTAESIRATDVNLEAATGPGAVSVLGYFKDHAAVGYGPGQSPEEWKRGLRWPRPGFCAIEDVRPGCLRLLCQTVQGFSGAPIFSAAAPGKVAVVGFVSRAAVADGAACGPATSYVTIAASADVVGN
ncbi:MAG: trypsin-like serine protease [Phenylobacterium sp.]